MVKRYRDNEYRSARPRFGSPSKDPRNWAAKPTNLRTRSAKNGVSGINNMWIMAPLTAVLSGAVFWGVWTWTAPTAPLDGGAMALAATADSESASFSMCHEGGGYNCVVDGDTIYYQGTKIRIADIDTPETHEPQCAEEAQRGAEATQRMQQLVNAGPFSLQAIDRDEDNYGRKLRVINRGGESLGGVLVNEGLARWYAGGRRPWC